MTTNTGHQPGFDMHMSFASQGIFRSGTRPTVTVIPVYDDKVGLVWPKKAGKELWWVPPQGEVLPGDGTMMMATLRKMKEDLGLDQGDLIGHRIKPLYRFTNTVPPERANGGMVKEHFVVGVPIVSPRRVTLNQKKVSGITWVQEPSVLMTLTRLVADRRPVKHGGVCAALSVARTNKLISWAIH